MDVQEWQDRLEAVFSGPSNIVGERLSEIIEMETEHKLHMVREYRGHRFLSDSFFDFYIETFQVARNWVNKNGFPDDAPNYSTLIVIYVTIFRNLRAAENLFLLGYPLNGYALLRNVKDQAIFLGAIANGITSLSDILGYYGSTDPKSKMTLEEFKKRRYDARKEETRVLNIMLRKESGLKSDLQYELTLWEDLFNLEVHGSRFTWAFELKKWLIDKKPLSMGPKPIENASSMYMNRVSEIEWLILRTFPFLQLKSHAFGDEWATKWRVLDESFLYMVKNLGDKLGKKIAYAIIALVENKYKFSPENYYIER